MSITALPSMEHTFTIKINGSETRKAYDGSFTYKRPSLRIRSEIAKTEARLNGDLTTLDEDQKFLHKVYATNRWTLIKVPEWFKECDYGIDLHDVNVSLEVYKAGKDFEDEWFNKVWGENTETPQETDSD